jgi:hypothetical protein
MQMRELRLTSIPMQIEITDLQSNNKLFSEDEIAQIHSGITADGHYRNINIAGEETRLRYAVIAQDGKLFAVYSGDKKHVLGAGRYGKVKLAQDLETGEWVALKVQMVFKDRNDLYDNLFENELEMLVLLEAVIMTKNVELHPVVLQRWAEHKKREQNYLLMNLARGKELFDVAAEILSHPQKYNIGQLLKIIISMIKQVQYAHEKHVLHRDIKLENFCVDVANLKVVLIDFGLSVKADDSNI